MIVHNSHNSLMEINKGKGQLPRPPTLQYILTLGKLWIVSILTCKPIKANCDKADHVRFQLMFSAVRAWISSTLNVTKSYFIALIPFSNFVYTFLFNSLRMYLCLSVEFAIDFSPISHCRRGIQFSPVTHFVENAILNNFQQPQIEKLINLIL